MKIKDNSKDQLEAELASLRRRLEELEALEASRKRIAESLQKSEENYRSLVESTEDSIYLVDRQYRYIYMNREHLSRLSLLGNEFLGRHYSEFHTVKETRAFVRKVEGVFKTGTSSFHEYQSSRDNRYFLQTFSPVKDASGRITAVTVVSKDVTDRKKAEELIHQAKHDWEDTFNSISDMITIHDRECNIIRANRSAEKILGLPFLLTGRKCHKYFHGMDSPPDNCPGRESMEKGEPVSREFLEPYLGRYLEVRAIPRFDGSGRVSGVIHVVRDITERKNMEEKLHTMSLTDELTGLLNRRGFFSYSQKQLKIAERSRRTMSVIYADLDGLKKINDTWGHEEGDAAILEAASLLRDTFRESDIISRLGGDEFAVLVEITESNDELIIKKRLEEKISILNARENRKYSLLMSVGIVRYDPDHPCSVDELLSRSDKLMYADKKRKA